MDEGHLKKIKQRIGNKFNLGGMVCCPRCGYNYSHVSVEPLASSDTGTRQGGFAVIFWGECDHSWADIYAEHKGQVVKVRALLEDEEYA